MRKITNIGIIAFLIGAILLLSSCQSASIFMDALNSMVEDESVDASSEEESEESKSELSNEESEEADDVINQVSRDEYDAPAGDSPIADLYEYCIDSCVSVVCTIVVESQGGWGTPSTYETTSLGSGFIIDGGYVVTNHHVIEGAKETKVVFSDGDSVEAEIIGSDKSCDIAVLKVKTSKSLVPVKIGDSSAVRIGEEVIAIGTPSGIEFAGTLTYGVISGLNRKVDIYDDYGKVLRTMYLLQTDATLNPGNSGGPLFNMNGEVIGVNNMKLISSYEGIGFSIPINGAMEIIEALIKGEDIPDSDYVTVSAYMGITGASVSDVRKQYNLGSNVPDGVFVVTVERNTSVYKAGLNAYDVITKFEGVEVKTVDELKEELSKYGAGKEVTIEVYRASRLGNDGETLTLRFKLDKAS